MFCVETDYKRKSTRNKSISSSIIKLNRYCVNHSRKCRKNLEIQHAVFMINISKS